MKYIRTTLLWITRFPGPDLSCGIHFCWALRVDIHILFWMISIGNVPLYKTKRHKLIAVSNSYHSTKHCPVRVGVPY